MIESLAPAVCLSSGGVNRGRPSEWASERRLPVGARLPSVGPPACRSVRVSAHTAEPRALIGRQSSVCCQPAVGPTAARTDRPTWSSSGRRRWGLQMCVCLRVCLYACRSVFRCHSGCAVRR